MLAEQGIQVLERHIKICPDLRNPLPFESSTVSCIHCPGMILSVNLYNFDSYNVLAIIDC